MNYLYASALADNSIIYSVVANDGRNTIDRETLVAARDALDGLRYRKGAAMAHVEAIRSDVKFSPYSEINDFKFWANDKQIKWNPQTGICFFMHYNFSLAFPNYILRDAFAPILASNPKSTIDYPIDSKAEYEKAFFDLTLWDNPKRWEAVDMLIAKLDDLINLLDGAN